jgi:hypothetical protein
MRRCHYEKVNPCLRLDVGFGGQSPTVLVVQRYLFIVFRLRAAVSGRRVAAPTDSLHPSAVQHRL